MTTKLSTTHFSPTIAGLSIGLFLAASHSTQALEKSCHRATPIGIESTYHSSIAVAGDTERLRVDLLSAGILVIEATVPTTSSTAPVLGHLITACDEQKVKATAIDRSAARLVIAIESPGSYFFRASAQNPRHALGDYRINSHFLPTAVSSRELDIPYDVAKLFGSLLVSVTQVDFTTSSYHKSDQQEFDPNPAGNPSRSVLGETLPALSLLRIVATDSFSKSDQQEFDPNPAGQNSRVTRGTLRSFDIPIPAGMMIGGTSDLTTNDLLSSWLSATVERRLQAAWNTGGVLDSGSPLNRIPWSSHCLTNADDHGDSSLCATPLSLGATIEANIGNTWGDDVDLYEISLSALTSVEINAASHVDIHGALYDRHGNRLAVDADFVESGFYLSKTLPPGDYTIRVEGDLSTEGSYTLTTSLRDW